MPHDTISVVPLHELGSAHYTVSVVGGRATVPHASLWLDTASN